MFPKVASFAVLLVAVAACVTAPTQTESPSPPTTSEPTATTAAAFECVGPPLPPADTPRPDPLPRLLDETGLVVSCIQTDTITELVGTINVSNPSEPNAIHVMWETAPCDSGIVFSFRARSDGFELVGQQPVECARPSTPLPLYITFSRPIRAADVNARLVSHSGP